MKQSKMRFAKSHEWVLLDGDVVTMGITQHAVELLTEPTFLELPKIGLDVSPEQEIGVIESVKSTSPIYSPVKGRVKERNDSLESDLSPVNEDPFGKGWMLKIKLAPGATLDHLMSKDEYEAMIAE